MNNLSKKQREKALDLLEKLVKNELKPEEIVKNAKLMQSYFLTRFTTEHTGKMSGLVSISTARPAACKERAKDKNSICSMCFVDKLNWRIDKKMNENAAFLTRAVLPIEWIPRLNWLYVRIEAFGDLHNEMHAENYLNLIKKNPETHFGWFTKIPYFLAKAIEKTGKPENVVLILSSYYLNKKGEKMLEKYPFFDRLFTVYTPDFIQENGVEINCGARDCRGCLNCYRHEKAEKFISEKLK